MPTRRSRWSDSAARCSTRSPARRRSAQAGRRPRRRPDAAPPQTIASAVPRSRVDLAASVLGSAHALDRGTRVEAATTRALAHVAGRADARTLWEQAGVHLDLTSGPVLTWNLPVVPGDRPARRDRRRQPRRCPAAPHPVRAAHPSRASCPPTPTSSSSRTHAGRGGGAARDRHARHRVNGNPSGAVRLCSASSSTPARTSATTATSTPPASPSPPASTRSG